MITRSCGDCVLCCKVFEVDNLKVANVLCQHCDGTRCRIYDVRPKLCAEFECMYRLNNALGEHWYPLISHIVIRTIEDDIGNTTMVFTVDPDHLDAWRKEPYFTEIVQCSQYGFTYNIYRTEVHVGGKIFPIVPREFINGATDVIASLPDRRMT